LPAPSGSTTGEPSSAEPLEQVVDRDEVGERADAVDLDHRQVLTVGGLERRVAGDVDELQVERVPVASLRDDLERTIAEVTPRRVVDRDSSQGDVAGRWVGRRVGRRGQG
jgi:hypothetical protein